MAGKKKSPSTRTALAKALSHPLRVRILTAMETRRRSHAELVIRKEVLAREPSTETEGEPFTAEETKILQEGADLSPNLLSKILEEPLGNVSYHMKTLVEYDVIKLTKTEPRRGAVEHFYASTGAATPDSAMLGGVNIRAADAGLVADAIEFAVDGAIMDEKDKATLESVKGELRKAVAP